MDITVLFVCTPSLIGEKWRNCESKRRIKAAGWREFPEAGRLCAASSFSVLWILPKRGSLGFRFYCKLFYDFALVYDSSESRLPGCP